MDSEDFGVWVSRSSTAVAQLFFSSRLHERLASLPTVINGGGHGVEPWSETSEIGDVTPTLLLGSPLPVGTYELTLRFDARSVLTVATPHDQKQSFRIGVIT